MPDQNKLTQQPHQNTLEFVYPRFFGEEILSALSRIITNSLLINILNHIFRMGNFRSEAEVTKHNKVGKNGNIEFAVSHMCGWRLYMEDAFIAQAPYENNVGLFGVFDGHGGPQVSAFVERHFSGELSKNENFKKKNYEKALRETFMKMDVLLMSEKGKKQVEQIQKQMRQKENAPKYEEPSHAGCTANVVLITPDKIYCANAGDSRAVAFVNKSVNPLSYDHKPENQKQIKRIEKAGGRVQLGRVNGNLNLSRAMGDLEYKQDNNISQEQQLIIADPDIKVIDNKKVDFIIMGCDGIWQVKSNEQMVDWVNQKIAKKHALKDILNQLLSELVSKDSSSEYGMDNMSAILIKFDQ